MFCKKYEDIPYAKKAKETYRFHYIKRNELEEILEDYQNSNHKKIREFFYLQDPLRYRVLKRIVEYNKRF